MGGCQQTEHRSVGSLAKEYYYVMAREKEYTRDMPSCSVVTVIIHAAMIPFHPFIALMALL